MISIFVLLCLGCLIIHGNSSDWTNEQDFRTSYMFSPLNVDEKKTSDSFADAGIQYSSSIVKSVSSVYVSMTTISGREGNAYRTVVNLLKGKIVPTHIYLFVSSEPKMLDTGIPVESLSTGLLDLAIAYKKVFSIVYTANIGPHRKLLPLLAKKWDEDCIIITLDDESDTSSAPSYRSEIVSQLLKYSKHVNHEDVISLRARRIGVCRAPPYATLQYRWWSVVPSNLREMLLLPTGTGGVLYRPRFFHPIVFSQQLINITRTTDDLHFRLSTMAGGRHVTVGCVDGVRGRCKDRISLYANGTYDVPHMWKRFNSTVSSGPNQAAPKHMRRKTLTDAADKQAPLPRMMRRKGRILSEETDATLFEANRKGGNDRQWNSAMKYMSRKGALKMSEIQAKYAPLERKACLPAYWDEVFAKNPQYARLGLTQPTPSRVCSVKKCSKE
jgi:hypothetical protein